MADLGILEAEVQMGPNARVGRGLAGASVSPGQALYKDGAAGHSLKPAQATGEAQANVVGVALNAAEVGQPVAYQMPGDEITLGAAASPAVGEVYALSAAAAGGIAPVGDLVAGNLVTVLGVGKAGGRLQLLGGASAIAKA